MRHFTWGNKEKQKTLPADPTPQVTTPPERVMLLVMGPTGVGKSTFINLASGSDLRVSDSLASCTDRIELSNPFMLDGKEVVLVDTPGFDDSAKSDAEVLDIVCDFLASEYKQNHLLHGILYFYRITDNRVSGTAARNLQFYQHLCGDDALKNSALVTNFWDAVQAAVGQAREEELKSKPVFFKHALDLGARYVRHDGTAASAQAVLRNVLGNTPRALLVQRELVDENRAVAATTAGETLLKDLARLMQQHQKELQQLERDLEDALHEHDAQTQRELEEERAKLRAEQARLEEETKKLTQLKAERAQLGQAQTQQPAAEVKRVAGAARPSTPGPSFPSPRSNTLESTRPLVNSGPAPPGSHSTTTNTYTRTDSETRSRKQKTPSCFTGLLPVIGLGLIWSGMMWRFSWLDMPYNIQGPQNWDDSVD